MVAPRIRAVRRLALTGVPLITVTALVAWGAPVSYGAARTSAAPLNCGSSFNPYAHSRAAVSACGYQTFPLAATHAMPGGGTSYDYIVHGKRVRIYVPPAGFNPGTATDARLNEYGLPPRPSTTTASAQWRRQMHAWKGAARPLSFLAETHAHAGTAYSGNWSGYMVLGNNGTYTHGEAWYVEPTYYSSQCSTNAEVTWAGIGGWNYTTLGQDGTAHGVPGIADHMAWWEIWPDTNMFGVNLFGHPGYWFDASTRWLGGAYRFYMYDYYSGTTFALDVSDGNYSGNSAEAIAERPTINGSWSYLSNFGTLYFEQSQANGYPISDYSPSGVRYGDWMQDGNGSIMAEPSAIGSGGYFTDTQTLCY